VIAQEAAFYSGTGGREMETAADRRRHFACAALMRAQSFSFSECISKMSASASKW
jgi:hypothetical protein